MTGQNEQTKIEHPPSEKDFAESIAKCQSVDEIKEKCLKLVAQQEAKYNGGTPQKNLTKYRKLIQTLHNFYEIKPELLKPRTFKNKETGEQVTENQSIALDYLVVSKVTADKIQKQSEEKTYSRAKDDTVIDVRKVFEVAEKLLESDNEVQLALAIQTFTGRRISEIFLGEFVEDDTHTMIFNGQLKTRDSEKATSDYLIPVLFDSAKLEVAANKLRNYPNVKSLWASDDKAEMVDNRFGRRIRELFQSHFGSYFPKSQNSKEGNGSSHQLRALYASILGNIYPKTSGKIDYIAKALGDTVGQVNQYFRFDIENIPNIPLQLTIEEIGMITTAKKKSTESTFDMDKFVRLLSPEGLLKFNHALKSGEMKENFLADAVNKSAVIVPVPKEIESVKTDHLKLAFDTMLRYNHQCPEGQQIRIEPTSLGNVYTKISDKRMFIGKLQDFIKANEQIIESHHQDLAIPDNQNHRLRKFGMALIMDNIAKLIIRNE